MEVRKGDLYKSAYQDTEWHILALEDEVDGKVRCHWLSEKRGELKTLQSSHNSSPLFLLTSEFLGKGSDADRLRPFIRNVYEESGHVKQKESSLWVL